MRAEKVLLSVLWYHDTAALKHLYACAYMRLIFMGTPAFAVPSLEVLLANGYEVVAVVTAPDKPRGRGRKVMPSPVKVAASAYNIPVLQPVSLQAPSFLEHKKSTKQICK